MRAGGDRSGKGRRAESMMGVHFMVADDLSPSLCSVIAQGRHTDRAPADLLDP